MATRFPYPIGPAALLALTMLGDVVAAESLEPIGAHWTRREVRVEEDGSMRSHSVVQLETGLNRLDERGEWVPAAPVIAIEKGVARALGTQHEVTFSSDINTRGGVRLVMPDGQVLESHVHGLAYFDSATGAAVLFAPTKDSEGVVHPPNQVIYPDAFEEVAADVRYTHSKAGLEQDIILRGSPPSPELFGMDPATTRLEVWTEFIEAPIPARAADTIAARRPDNAAEERSESLVDETLDFGPMQMRKGRTFALGSEEESLALIAKQWMEADGRRFLVETVAVEEIKEAVGDLPESPTPTNREASSYPSRLEAMAAAPVKPRRIPSGEHVFRTASPEMLIAANSTPGLVLDYSINGSLNNFTFDGTQLYEVTGPVSFGGTNTTFGAGTVIRFANTNNAKITVNTPMTWLGETYRPVVFTAYDDPVLGNRNQSLSGYYAQTALEIYSVSPFSIQNVRFVNAKTAISITGSGAPTISHAQFVNCETGIRMGASVSAALRNAMFFNVLTNFNTSVSGAAVRGEHISVHTAARLNASGYLTVTLTNSLLGGVTNTGTYTGVSVGTSSNPANLFTTVGGGRCYLTTSSSHRNAGVTTINPALLTQLGSLTTYPPTVLQVQTFTSPTTWGITALRDTSQPDRGYHYPPIDYAVRQVTFQNTTLNIGEGVTVAGFGSVPWGVRLTGSASICSKGSPIAMTRFTRPHVVQEQPEYWSGKPTGSFVSVSTGTTGELGLRFTSFDYLLSTIGTTDTVVWSDGSPSTKLGRLLMRDCHVFNGNVWYYGYPTGAPLPISLINNLVLGGWFSFNDALHLELRNNTFRNWILESWPSGPSWLIQDNVFDACLVIEQYGSSFNSHNAYVNGTEPLSGSHSNDIILPVLNWQSVTNGSHIGRYYPVGTALVNKGSRAADETRLAYHTILASQARESTSQVDLGYHYVALYSNGLPLDINNAGGPDYRENESSLCACDQAGGCANLRPAVTLRAPLHGQMYLSSLTNVQVQVAALDMDGVVTNVAIYTNNVLAANLTTATEGLYTWNWDLIGPSTNTVRAVATDNGSLSISSPSHTFIVNDVPYVAINTPTSITEFPTGSSVAFAITAYDSNQIASVTLHYGTNVATTATAVLTNGYYKATLNGLTNGAYIFRAKATDTRGASRDSAPVAFRIRSAGTLPTVTINSPGNGEEFHRGREVTIRAALSSTNNVSEVKFYSGDTYLGSDHSPPYALAVNALGLGDHRLVAKAVTTVGTTGSPPVQIRVVAPGKAPYRGYWDTTGIGANQLILGESFAMRDIVVTPDGDTYGAKWAQHSTPYPNAPMKRLGYVWEEVAGFNPSLSGMSSAVWRLGNIQYTADRGILRMFDGNAWSDSTLSWEFADQYSYEAYIQRMFEWEGDLLIGGTFQPTNGLPQYIGKLPVGAISNNVVAPFGPSPSFNGPVRAFAKVGQTLYVGGAFSGGGFTNLAARSPSGTWSNVGGATGPIWSLAAWNGKLVVGGAFENAGENQNADCIAIYNAGVWESIGGGVSHCGTGNYGSTWPDLPDVGVLAVGVRGDTIYFGGRFEKVHGGSGYLFATNIAAATWDSAAGEWTLDAMDGGVSVDGGPSYVSSIAITSHEEPLGYDVLVGGDFTKAGTKRAIGIARWRVRPEDATVVPGIVITQPLGGAELQTNSTWVQIDLDDIAGRFTLEHLRLYANGTLVEDRLYPSDPASVLWTPGTNGFVELWATVEGTDSVQTNDPVRFATSPRVLVRVGGAQPLIPTNSFQIVSDPVEQVLEVLPTPALQSQWTITGVSRLANLGPMEGGMSTKGVVTVQPGGKALGYRPYPGGAGTDIFQFTASNGTTQTTVPVVVQVVARPVFQFSSPPDNLVTNSGVSLQIAGSALVNGGTVSSMQLFVNGQAKGTFNNVGSFATNLTFSSPGRYTIRAVTTAGVTALKSTNEISIRASRATGDVPSVAVIAALTNSVQTLSSFNATNWPVVKDGFLTVVGTASDPNSGDLVQYSLKAYRVDNPTLGAVAGFTPPSGTVDEEGFAIGPVVGSTLGTLNLDRFENGVYDIVLEVRSGGQPAITSVRILLESQLKIGRLTFSETDLTVPVGGMPLTIIRTYDSFALDSKDFGHGWSLELVDLDLRMDEERSLVEPFLALGGSDPNDYSLPPINVRSGGGYNISALVPGAGRTSFRFNPRREQFTQEMSAEWDPDPRTGARVLMPGNNKINFISNGFGKPGWSGAPSIPFEAFDIPAIDMVLRDGTTFHLERSPGGANAPSYYIPYGGSGEYAHVQPRAGPFRVTSIEQPTGDRILVSDTEITHRSKNSTTSSRKITLARDALGRITGVWDPLNPSNSNALIAYVYSELTGDLMQVRRMVSANPLAYVTNSYSYDDPRFPHYVTGMHGPAGSSRQYFDDSGALVAVVDPLGNTNRFIHERTLKLEKVVDALDVTNSIAYDVRGNIIATTNAVGTAQQEISTFGYDDDGNQITSTNPVGVVTRIGYVDGLPTAVTNAYGTSLQQVSTTEYGGFGQVLKTRDALGRETTYSYLSGTPLLSAVTGPGGLILSNTYDSRNRLVSSVDASGGVTTNEYDAVTGDLLRTVSGWYSGGTWVPVATNRFLYDASGRQYASIDPRGTTNAIAFDTLGRAVATTNAFGLAEQSVSRTVYDAAGRIASTVDPAGVTTAFGYDALGRQVSVTHAWGTPIAQITLSSYDAAGRVTNQVQYAGSTASLTTRTQYDSRGRATNVVRAFGTTNAVTTQTAYDSLGRVAHTVDARGIINGFTYDALGRRIAATNAWGTALAQVTTSGYDAVGNLTSVTHVPSGQVTGYVYDALNRRTQTILPPLVGGGANVTNAVAYDAGGRKVAETTRMAGAGQPGVVTVFAYDPLGRMLSVTNGWGSTGISGISTATNWARFVYDGTGSVVQQVDALNRTNTYSYDALGRRIGERMPGAQLLGLAYDTAGRLTTRTNADGIRVRYSYDALGRLTNQWTLTTGGGSNHVAALGYGPSGLLTNRLDASGTHQWVHDILGRLRTNVTPVGTLHYTYDAAGNPLTLASTTANGVNLSYGYDALGRLTNVVDLRLTSANKNTAYAYDAAGNLSWLHYRPISVTNLHTYDPHNRLTSLAWRTTNGTTRASFTYTVHTLGMRTGLSETVNGTGRTYTWGYDALHRLKSEALTGWVPNTANYTHDLVGNRTSRSAALGLPNQNLNYDINDWLDNDGVTNTVSTHFDAKGNTVNYAAVTYGYDWDNRLTSSSAGGFSAVYDLEGNRTRKTAGGVTTHFLVATVNPTGWPQVVEEHTGTNPGTVTRRYTYGADLISQSRTNSSAWHTDFFLTDGLGSTRALLNSSGGISDTYTYDAFGNLLTAASSGTTPNHYRYTGEQWDNELGMYYLRARYMSPAMGRFWSRDTFEGHPTDPLSLHRYLYVHGNPVNNIDPSGHADLNVASLTSAIGIIGMQASQYISRVPAMAATAFRSGGQAVGQFYNQFGAVVQNFGQQTINLLPRIQQMRPALEGFTRRPDFLLRAGNALRAIEGKYQLPSGGEALTRMGSQVQQFSQWASQGVGREVVVWALKHPENIAKAEQTVLQAAGNPQGVRFVYGVEGLFQYLSQWASF